MRSLILVLLVVLSCLAPVRGAGASGWPQDVAGARTLRGRLLVAGDAGGTPLAGAILRLLHRDDAASQVEELARVRTDAEGRFVVGAPLREGWQALVVADSESRVPVATVVYDEVLTADRLPGSAPLQLGDRVVAPPGALALEIVDRRTREVVGPGALVGARIDSEVVRVFGLLEGGRVVARTDAEGRAVLERLPPGRVDLVVLDQVHQPEESWADVVAGERVDVPRIELRKGHYVVGEVLDPTGRVVVGAEVRLLGASRAAHALGGDDLRLTGADGQFRWTNLEAGEVALWVRAEGWPEHRFQMRTGSRIQRLALPMPHALRVRVVGDLADVAVERVGLEFETRVAGRNMDSSWVRRLGYAPGTCRVAEDFTFERAQVAPGSYRVRAVVDGLGASDWLEFAVEDADVALELRFDPPVAHRIEVRAVDEMGRPLQGAEVLWLVEPPESALGDEAQQAASLRAAVARNASELRGGVLRTDGEGRCVVEVPPDVELAFAVSLDGRWPVVQRFERSPGAGVDAPIVAVLRAAGAVEVQVTGVGAAGDGSKRLWLLQGEARLGLLRCERDGTYRFAPLLPGSYRVAPIHVDWQRYEREAVVRSAEIVGVLGLGPDPVRAREVEVQAGETVTLGVAFPEAGAVVGTVTESGAPVPGAEVFAIEYGPDGDVAPFRGRGGEPKVHGVEPPWGVPVSVTDRDGRFRFAVRRDVAVEFWVRLRDTVVSSGPVRVHLEAGREQVVDLVLGGGRVLGRLDRALVPKSGTADEPQVWLFPEREIEREVFVAASDWPSGLVDFITWGDAQVPVEVDADGVFRIDHVPPGRFVLRVTGAGLKQAIQVPLRIAAGVTEEVEIAPRALHRVQLLADFGLGPEAGDSEEEQYFGRARRRFDGFERNAFEARVRFGGSSRSCPPVATRWNSAACGGRWRSTVASRLPVAWRRSRCRTRAW